MLTPGRAGRVEGRSRHLHWALAPLRVESSSCVNCDACLTACPPVFGAVVHRRFAPAIVPELCSGCGRCVPACPVDCIVENPDWTPAPAAWWDDLQKVDARA